MFVENESDGFEAKDMFAIGIGEEQDERPLLTASLREGTLSVTFYTDEQKTPAGVLLDSNEPNIDAYLTLLNGGSPKRTTSADMWGLVSLKKTIPEGFYLNDAKVRCIAAISALTTMEHWFCLFRPDSSADRPRAVIEGNPEHQALAFTEPSPSQFLDPKRGVRFWSSRAAPLPPILSMSTPRWEIFTEEGGDKLFSAELSTSGDIRVDFERFGAIMRHDALYFHFWKKEGRGSELFCLRFENAGTQSSFEVFNHELHYSALIEKRSATSMILTPFDGTEHYELP
jgi:hypothetical protein